VVPARRCRSLNRQQLPAGAAETFKKTPARIRRTLLPRRFFILFLIADPPSTHYAQAGGAAQNICAVGDES
jgi:hypothetical protein